LCGICFAVERGGGGGIGAISVEWAKKAGTRTNSKVRTLRKYERSAGMEEEKNISVWFGRKQTLSDKILSDMGVTL